MKKEVTIFWFRRDLRTKDNMGLFWALKENTNVLPIFIFDKSILENLDKDDTRVSFIHQNLSELKEELKAFDSDLLTLHDTPQGAWNEVLKNYKVTAVYANEDYEPYGIKRDLSIAKLLKKHSIPLHTYKDHCIFAKDDILKADGKPYTVYTPYKNKWLQTLCPSDLASINSQKYRMNFLKGFTGVLPSLNELGFNKVDSDKFKFPKAAIKRNIITHYDKQRDIPSLDATSHLGIHIRFGTVSIRRLAAVAYELNATWLSELIWREFFIQILYHFPYAKDQSFREKYRNIKWLNSKKDFKKWCKGETGFALVDAGMRELNQTGHMHNRVRMLVASFLVKDLLIDWRWGEKYFASKLLDFELASNNGNWQWAAGVGCDAAPYFRIFNPHTQLKKFDPDLAYVKKWVPEYGTDSYVEEMIDHKVAYHRALSTYKTSIN